MADAHDRRQMVPLTELVSYAGGPTLGNVEAGAVATVFGVRTSVVSGGVLCVLGTALLAFALPLFWRYDGRSQRLPVSRPVL